MPAGHVRCRTRAASCSTSPREARTVVNDADRLRKYLLKFGAVLDTVSG